MFDASKSILVIQISGSYEADLVRIVTPEDLPKKH